MKKVGTKWKIAFLSAVILSLLLAGCGGSSDENYNETSIEITKKGNVNNTIIESFDKSYYDEEELKSIIDDEISAHCNRKGSDDAAELKEFKVSDGTAVANFKFLTSDDYAEFNGVEFFYGTVEEAINRGYEMDVTLKSVKDDETIGKSELEAMKSNKIVVVSESIAVSFPEELLYTTANIDILGKKSGRMSSESSGLGYMILEEK